MRGSQRVPGRLADQGHSAAGWNVHRDRGAALPVKSHSHLVMACRDRHPTFLSVPDGAPHGAVHLDLEPAQEEAHGARTPDDDDPVVDTQRMMPAATVTAR